jgi:transcriptional regulator with XRE-family HTH domain
MDYCVNDEFKTLVEMQKERVKNDILESYIAIRKKRGITQQQIADYTGMQRTNVVRIESGRYLPTLEVLVKLAAALDMDLEVKLVERNRENE